VAGLVAGGMAPGAVGVGAGPATTGVLPSVLVIGGVAAAIAGLSGGDATTVHH
jgi:hypothetical protein